RHTRSDRDWSSNVCSSDLKEKNPAGVLRFPAGFVDWADQPCSDPRLSPRACLNRQAGFTAARLAANWIPSAATWTTPTHNLEVRSEEHTSELQSRSDLVCR